jgi:hypothetical protein
MNRITVFSLFACLLLSQAGAPPARSQASDAAVLRCDPYVIIYRIDGSPDGHGGTGGSSFKDCSIPLGPGTHTLEVCYDASSQSMTTQTLARCDKPKDISFETAAARTYRLRTSMGSNWRAWVDDVTDAEAGYWHVDRPRKPRPANKAERKSTLILQISPQHVIPRFHRGRFLGPWFVPARAELKGENTGIAKAAPDGFVVVEADAGDSLTITNVRLLEGSVFMPKQYFACGDYQPRVFEDIPGGKVLYLGHLELDGNANEQRTSWADDIETARQYVDAHFPKLAGKLEPTPFTTRRLPELCALYPAVLKHAP